jgi:hypothetical protein
MPRTATVEFVSTDPRRQNISRDRREGPQAPESEKSDPEPLHSDERSESPRLPSHRLKFTRILHLGSARRSQLEPHPTLTQHPTMHSQYGGFPMPHQILGSLFHKFFPKLQKKLKRSVTYPAITTITSKHGGTRDAGGSKVVPYITFDAVVGHNSTFHLLTNEQLEELGGVEYRALNALLYIVAGVGRLPATLSCSDTLNCSTT